MCSLPSAVNHCFLLALAQLQGGQGRGLNVYGFYQPLIFFLTAREKR